jgi:hypothetical protein
MSLHALHATHVAADTQVSGSIIKIYSPVDGLTLNPTDFGHFVEQDTNIPVSANHKIEQTIASAIPVIVGTYLEGPIVQTKCLTRISIVYHKGPLRVLTP